MTLKEYLDTLPNERQEKIKKLRELTLSSEPTFWRWMNGRCKVPPLAQKTIADYVGLPADELFPNSEMTAV